MGGTLRIVRTVADRNPDEWTSEMRADGFHGLAKVRVASSNLVIRSKVIPGERPFRGVSRRVCGHAALPFLQRCLAVWPENALGGPAVGANQAAVGVISAATDDVSSVAPRLRPKGSGGIFFVREGV